MSVSTWRRQTWGENQACRAVAVDALLQRSMSAQAQIYVEAALWRVMHGQVGRDLMDMAGVLPTSRLLKLLIVVIAAVLVWHPGRAEQRVALVIGNGAYVSLPSLDNPPTDAAAVATRLRSLGFDVTEGINLGKAAMDQNVRSFGLKAASSDVAMVFYAGHGVQVAGHNYLVPVDASLPSREQDLLYDFVNVAGIMDELAGAKRLRIVVLDACRDNPIPAGLQRSLGRGLATDHGLASPPGLDNTLIAYATAADAVAADGTGKDSPFTTALLNHLSDPGLDVRLMFGRVRDEVRRATGNRQNPFVYESLGGDAFYFQPVAAEPPLPSPPAHAEQAAMTTQPRAAGADARPDWATFLDGRWRLSGDRTCTGGFGTAALRGNAIRFEWHLPNGRLNVAVERIDQVNGNVVSTTVLSDVGTPTPEVGNQVRYEFYPDRWTSENLVTHERGLHPRC